jgi:hypothetical protein
MHGEGFLGAGFRWNVGKRRGEGKRFFWPVLVDEMLVDGEGKEGVLADWRG